MSAPTVTLFVQVPDAVVQSHGLIVAAVYGCIRRYIMFGGGHKCHHTLDEIANTLNLNKKTAQRAIDRLEGDGLIATERPKGRVMTIRLAGAIQFAERADVGRMTLDTESTPTQDFKSTPAANPGLRVHTTQDTESTPFLIGEIRKEEESAASAAPTGILDQSAFASDQSGHAVTVAQSASSSSPSVPPAEPPTPSPSSASDGDAAPAKPPTFTDLIRPRIVAVMASGNTELAMRKSKAGGYLAWVGQAAGMLGRWFNDDAARASAFLDWWRRSDDWKYRGLTSERWLAAMSTAHDDYPADSTGRRVVSYGYSGPRR